MKILMTGPTGSGKTTQATILANFLSVPFIGVGRMLRQKSRSKTNGQKIQQAFDKGLLVDDRIVAEVVKKRLDRADCSKGFVIDGYPRSLGQLQHFDPKFDKVFFLQLSDQEARARLLKRGRGDDTVALINKRLKIYHSLTQPVMDYFGSRGILQYISAQGQVKKIQQEIRNALLKRKNN